MMKNIDYIAIPSHDPGMQVGVPMHGIFGAQTVIKRIRIGKNFRVEEMVEA
jgi:hypothetical protein